MTDARAAAPTGTIRGEDPRRCETRAPTKEVSVKIPVPLPAPNHAEQVALFRHGVVGDLITSDLETGALQAELKKRAKRRYRPPASKGTRTYHWKTFQRWLYDAREGLAALKPESRERGFGLVLEIEAREMLLDMRREHPNAAADLILDEAIRHGVVAKDAISVPTLRRLFVRADLPRAPRNRGEKRRDRRRWEADRPCRIWHADVCHVWRREPDGSAVKVYVHGLIDDCSRFCPGLEGREGETENDLLALLVEALLRYPAPDVLYVDNGSTYRGDLLTLALSRLGIRVVTRTPTTRRRGARWNGFGGRCASECSDGSHALVCHTDRPPMPARPRYCVSATDSILLPLV